MAYSVGDLQLNIEAVSQEATQSIDVLIKKLQKLQQVSDFKVSSDGVASMKSLKSGIRSLAKSIEALNNVNVDKVAGRLKTIFTSFSETSKVIDVNAFNSLTAGVKSINSISKLDKVNFEKVSSGFTKLTVSITPFVDKIKDAEKSLVSLYGILNKVSGKKISNLNKLNLNAKPAGNTYSKSSLLSGASMYVTWRMAKQLGSALENIVQSGSDYYETLNLWQVAMRENLSDAEEFIQVMNKAYGVSEQTLMRSQAVFKNMIGSLGQISRETASEISKSVLQMALDYASLYNVSLEQATQKFQAALAGQVRPIRNVSGTDITETTIYQLYQTLGGTKTMRQLNRTEKQLLSILAIFKQMGASGAIGDMSKTLGSFANQSRMITQTWLDTKTWIGVIGRYLIDQSGMLVYINASLMTFSEILKAIAISMGAVGQDNFIKDIPKDTSEAEQSIEDLRGALLGFDKFRSLESDKQGGGLIQIDEKVLKALKQYESVLKNVKNTATELANTWLKALGFEEVFNDEGQLVGYTILESKLDKIKGTLKTIGVIGATVFGTILVGSVISFGKIAYQFALTPIIKIAKGIANFGLSIININPYITSLTVGLLGVSLLFQNILNLVNFGSMEGWQKMVSIFGLIGSAALVAAAGVAAFHGAWTMGTAAIAIGGGLAAIAGAFAAYKSRMADLGGDAKIDTSTMSGGSLSASLPTNYVGSANQGSSQSAYTGTYTAMCDWWGGSNAKHDIPELEQANPTGIYQAVTNEASARGLEWIEV